MGAALAEAALRARHDVTIILGPVNVAMPANVKRIDVETSRQMHAAVLEQFPRHDLLIMAAAVADFRPIEQVAGKLHRMGGRMTLELEPTEDILAAAGAIKRPDQRSLGFSLVDAGDIERSRAKILRKNVDLLIHNPTSTMSSTTIDATLLYPDGRTEPLGSRGKRDFADVLMTRITQLFS